MLSLIGILFLLSNGVSASRFQLTVYDVETGHPLDACDTGTADFGGSLERLFEYGTKSCAVVVDPVDACTPIKVIKKLASCPSHYVFVKRSSPDHPCHFSLQAYNIQQIKDIVISAIVFVNYPKELSPIDFTGSEYSDKIHLPLMMIANRCAVGITNTSRADKIRVFMEDLGYVENALYYLIPIISVIIFMLLVSLSAWVVRCCRQQQKNRQRRLQVGKLKSLPTRRYREGESLDQCVICVESFIPNEKIRILPCQHGFHSKCVDSWLTSFKKTCPLCKMTVDVEDAQVETRRVTTDLEQGSLTFSDPGDASFSDESAALIESTSTEHLIPTTSTAEEE